MHQCFSCKIVDFAWIGYNFICYPIFVTSAKFHAAKIQNIVQSRAGFPWRGTMNSICFEHVHVSVVYTIHALTVILVERYDDIPDALYVDCSLLKWYSTEAANWLYENCRLPMSSNTKSIICQNNNIYNYDCSNIHKI